MRGSWVLAASLGLVPGCRTFADSFSVDASPVGTGDDGHAHHRDAGAGPGAVEAGPAAGEGGVDAGTMAPDGGQIAHTGDAGESCEEHCENPDAQHCRARCVHLTNGVSCVVTALDQDGDGHGDRACTAAKPGGDDCDDRDVARHPGALELCNGADDDCNGLVDIEDGLAPSTLPRMLIQGSAGSVAWSGSLYGVSYVGSANQLLFAALNKSGELVFDRARVAPDEIFDASVAPTPPSIAWGDGAFGISWTRGADIRFRALDEDSIGQSSLLIKTAPGEVGPARVTALGDAAWTSLAALTHDTYTALAKFGKQGVISDQNVGVSSGDGGPPWLVRGAREILAVRRELTSFQGRTSLIRLSRYDLGLHVIAPLEVTLQHLDQPSHVEPPVAAYLGDHYALAWVEVVPGPEGMLQRLMFEELTGDEQVLCGPVDLARNFGPGALPLTLRDMQPSENGFLILATASLPAGDTLGVDLVQVRAGCEYVQRFRAQRTLPRSLPSLAAAGEQGFLLLFEAPNLGSGMLSVQHLGPRLCD
jgi:hypothetical protein